MRRNMLSINNSVVKMGCREVNSEMLVSACTCICVCAYEHQHGSIAAFKLSAQLKNFS